MILGLYTNMHWVKDYLQILYTNGNLRLIRRNPSAGHEKLTIRVNCFTVENL